MMIATTEVQQAAKKGTRDWESTFRTWSQGPGQTEQDRCDRAVDAVRKAIAASDALKARDIRVFPQGSYHNRTNVRQESDVDVGVVYEGAYFKDKSEAEGGGVGIDDGSPSAYSYEAFKNEVEEALVAHFGRAPVVRKNRHFDVHANTYRVDADVIACFRHRRYTARAQNGVWMYETGVELHGDDGRRTVNFPDQHYRNGNEKNQRTGKRFKRMVRVFKRMRNEMADEGVVETTPISSFLIECLLFNVRDGVFGKETYFADVSGILGFLSGTLLQPHAVALLREVNGIKPLFGPGNPWSIEQVGSFLGACVAHLASR